MRCRTACKTLRLRARERARLRACGRTVAGIVLTQCTSHRCLDVLQEDEKLCAAGIPAALARVPDVALRALEARENLDRHVRIDVSTKLILLHVCWMWAVVVDWPVGDAVVLGHHRGPLVLPRVHRLLADDLLEREQVIRAGALLTLLDDASQQLHGAVGRALYVNNCLPYRLDQLRVLLPEHGQSGVRLLVPAAMPLQTVLQLPGRRLCRLRESRRGAGHR